MKYSEWHLKRFASGVAPLYEGADPNVAAAYRFLSNIITLEDGEYALLLLKSIYFFIFFSFPDKRGRAAVSFETLRKAEGFSLTVKNPYPVLAAAEGLGIHAELRNAAGNVVTKRSDAEYITLGFSDRKVFKGLVEFERGAEEFFGRRFLKKAFLYFIAADFSFIKEADPSFIKKHFLAGYGDIVTAGAERVNLLLGGAEFLIDAKTEYKECFVEEAVALKKGMKTFLFSFEFGKRKDRAIFSFKLTRRSALRVFRRINDFSGAFVTRFLHENDCACNDCYLTDRKVIYKNKVYSVPFSEGKFSFPLRTEADFSDAIKIIEEIITSLPAYSKLLKALRAYEEEE